MIVANNIRPGMVFKHQDNLFLCLDISHHKLARASASVKIKMRNLKTNTITTNAYRSSEKMQEIKIKRVESQYLYSDNNDVYFMDTSTYEQIKIAKRKIKWELNFIKKEDLVQILQVGQEFLGLQLKPKVTLRVIEVESAVKGNTVNSLQVKAKLETGYELLVPSFIRKEMLIKVSTINGTYCGKKD